MAKAFAAIHSLDSLDREIFHLQLEAKKLEDRMDQQLDYLQNNYGKLLRRSLFNKAASATEQSGTLTGQLLNGFIQNEKVQGVLEKLMDMIAGKLASALEKLFPAG